MKRLFLALVLFVFSTSAFAQLSDGALPCNPKFDHSNYEEFLTTVGPYTKHQLSEGVMMKLVSPATLGGYTIRAEKTTDLTTGKSMQAISLIPNSSTGVGKLVSKRSEERRVGKEC